MTIARVYSHVGHCSVEVEIPVRIVSEMNSRDHWRTVRKRARDQHAAVFYSLGNFREILRSIAAANEKAIVVTFTRLGPGRFDDDNLAAGFKFCRDQVAKLFSLDDGDARFQWRYRQEKCRTHSARVSIESGSDQP